VPFVEGSLPFRWDLITPNQLGSLLDGIPAPDLWFLDELVACVGKVVARSGNGDLFFVGRSLDSMFDLLRGIFPGPFGEERLHRLPLSFHLPVVETSRRWRRRHLNPAEAAQGRRFLAEAGLTPYALARRDRPAVLVDVVDGGNTFSELFLLLRDFVEREREPWPVIRRKLRFVGVTVQQKTSPNTHRWQQHAAWTRELPASGVVNVSLDGFVWKHIANHQHKLTDSWQPEWWTAEGWGPGRDEFVRKALAEAVALVSYGRSQAGRQAFAHALGPEPGQTQPWLRALAAGDPRTSRRS
jgi:hypothetical protein